MKKFFHLNSVRKKFVLIITVLLLIIFTATGFITILDNISKTRRTLSNQAMAFAKLSTRPLAEAYGLYFDSGYYKFKEIYQDISRLDPSIKQIQFIDVNGSVIFDSRYLKDTEYLSPQTLTITPKEEKNALTDHPIYIKNPHHPQEITEIYYPYFTEWSSHPFTIRFFITYDQVKHNINTIVLQTLLIALVSVLIAILLITEIVQKFILSPISRLSQMAHNIALGQYGHRINISTNDEIEQLSNATNKMAATLEQNIKDLQELDKLKDEFVDIAAHNLKIPLNHIKFNIEKLISSSANLDKKNLALLKDIEINYHKLQLLSDDLINVTAIKQGTLDNSIFMPDDLVEVISIAGTELSSTAENKRISVNYQLPSTAPVLVDSAKIKQVFHTLIDNAIQYSKPDSQVNISLKEESGFFRTDIQDNGVGIAKEESSKLFQKFYRAPSSASYDPEGTGLGLYLAKLIIELHHGIISVQSEPGQGSTFSVALPKHGIQKNTSAIPQNNS